MAELSETLTDYERMSLICPKLFFLALIFPFHLKMLLLPIYLLCKSAFSLHFKCW